jgi:hypothetical protein
MNPRDIESIINVRVRLATAERVQQNLEQNADIGRKALARAIARVNTAAVTVRDLREHLAKLEGRTVTANAGASSALPDVRAFNATMAGNGIDDDRRQRLARSMWVKLQRRGELRVRGNASNADALRIVEAFANAGVATVKTRLGGGGIIVVPSADAMPNKPPLAQKRRHLTRIDIGPHWIFSVFFRNRVLPVGTN